MPHSRFRFFSVDAHVIAQIWNRREKHGCRPTHQWFGDFSPGGLKTSQWTKFQVSETSTGRHMHIDRISRFSFDAHVIAQIWNRREKHGCRPTHQWFGDFSPGGLKTSQWTKFQVSETSTGRHMHIDRISWFSFDAHVIAQIWNRREKHGCRPTHQWFGDFSPGGLKTSQWTKFQVSETSTGRHMHIDRISRFSVDAHVIAQIWNRREKHGCRPTHQWFGDFSQCAPASSK